MRVIVLQLGSAFWVIGYVWLLFDYSNHTAATFSLSIHLN